MYFFLNYAQEIFNFFRSLITGVFDPKATVTGIVIALLVPIFSVIGKILIENRNRSEIDKRQLTDFLLKKKQSEIEEINKSFKSGELLANEERRKKIWAKRFPELLEKEERENKALGKERSVPASLPYYLLIGATVLMGIFFVAVLIHRITQ